MHYIHELENNLKNGQNYLEVIFGPMFSGKTEELIRRIKRVEYARQNFIVFKPVIDNRYSQEMVVSHSEQKIDSIPVQNSTAIRSYLDSCSASYNVIGLDEVHLFDENIVPLCEELVVKGARVIAAGLGEDFLSRPFGPMPKLLAHADVVTKLWAVCMRCGMPASKTQRITRDGQKVENSQVLIGASNFYEARCRNCYQKKVLDLSHDCQNDVAIDQPSI